MPSSIRFASLIEQLNIQNLIKIITLVSVFVQNKTKQNKMGMRAAEFFLSGNGNPRPIEPRCLSASLLTFRTMQCDTLPAMQTLEPELKLIVRRISENVKFNDDDDDDDGQQRMKPPASGLPVAYSFLKSVLWCDINLPLYKSGLKSGSCSVPSERFI
jgi:hypothetical protein